MGVVSAIDEQTGRPTKVIMCSEQCDPPHTVCEVKLSSWIDTCSRQHGGCWISGCGGLYRETRSERRR